MTDVDGTYDCQSKTPMGDQQSVLVLTSEGGRPSATITFMGEQLTLQDLAVDQRGMTWRMTINQPFVIPLDGRATFAGDQLQGTIDAGPFGIFPVSGRKRGQA